MTSSSDTSLPPTDPAPTEKPIETPTKTPTKDPGSTAGLAGICLAALLFGLEISSVPTILPTLAEDLGGSFADLQWVVNAYVVAVATVLLPTGAVADRVGRRRSFLVSIAGFGAASLLCGLAPTVAVLVVARALQGLSGGAMLICQVAVLTDLAADPTARARAFGLWGVAFGTGLGFGPLVGAGLVEVAGWRSIFLVPSVAAGAAWVLVRRGPREPRDRSAPRLDVAGALLLAGAVLALTVATTRLPEPGWVLPGGVITGATSIVLLLAFVLVQRRVAHPMVPLGLLAHRRLAGALWGSVGMNTSFWPFVVFLPLYLERGLGLGLVTSGGVLLALTLPTLLVPPYAERLTLRVGAAVLVPTGLALIGAGLLAVWLVVDRGGPAGPSPWVLLPGLLLAGVGLGLTNTPVTNTATASVDARRAGVASGIDMSARMVTLAVSVGLLGLLLVVGIHGAIHGTVDGTVPAGTSQALDDLARQVADGRREDREAFSAGFGLVTLAAGTSALVAAVASRLTFGLRRVSDR